MQRLNETIKLGEYKRNKLAEIIFSSENDKTILRLLKSNWAQMSEDEKSSVYLDLVFAFRIELLEELNKMGKYASSDFFSSYAIYGNTKKFNKIKHQFNVRSYPYNKPIAFPLK